MQQTQPDQGVVDDMNDVLPDPLARLRDEIAEHVDDDDLMAAVDKVHHAPERDALLHRALSTTRTSPSAPSPGSAPRIALASSSASADRTAAQPRLVGIHSAASASRCLLRDSAPPRPAVPAPARPVHAAPLRGSRRRRSPTCRQRPNPT